MSQNSIFISHSSKEISFVDSLLLQEKKSDKYKLWAASNENIGLGKEFKYKITKAINDSSGAIILISNNLLTSEFVMEYELPLLIEKSKNSEDYFIIPILIEKCPWRENELLRELQLINSENTPLKDLKGKQYSVLIQEVSRYLNEYVIEINDKLKSKNRKKFKSLLRVSMFSLFGAALIYFSINYNLPTNIPEPAKNTPEQIVIDIESLSEEELSELLVLIENSEDFSESNSSTPNAVLEIKTPESCDSSNENTPIINRNTTSCFNLTDEFSPPVGWVSNESCTDEWIKFNFIKPIYIEFVVMQNYENIDDFNKFSTIKEFTFTTPSNEILSGSLDRQNSSSQWFDINLTTKELQLKIDSFDIGETTACGLQNITFYGRNQ